MWEASWGIILVLVIMFCVGIFASPARAKVRAQSRKDLEQVVSPLGAANRSKQSGVENVASNTPYVEIAVQQGDASPKVKEAAKKTAKGK